MVLFTHLAGRRASVLSRAEELQTATGGGAALPNHFICSLAVWLPYTSAGFGQGRRLKRKSIILSPLSVSFIPHLSVSISPTRYPTQSTLCKWKMSRRDHLAEPCMVRGKSPLSASMRHSVPLKYHRHYTGRRGADSGAAPPAPLTQVPLRVTYTKTTNFAGAKGVRERNRNIFLQWIQLCGKIWLETPERSSRGPWSLLPNDLASSLICSSVICQKWTLRNEHTFCTCILITIFLLFVTRPKPFLYYVFM